MVRYDHRSDVGGLPALRPLDLRLKAGGFGPRERERTHARKPPMETMENDRRAAYYIGRKDEALNLSVGFVHERTKHSN